MKIQLTAVGGGYYRVYVDGVEVSKHVAEREAVERAVNEANEKPDAKVHYSHPDYIVNVVVYPSTGTPVTPPVLGSKTLLTSSKLQFVGGFRFPHFSGGTVPGITFTGGARGGACIQKIGNQYVGFCLNNEGNEQSVVEGKTSAPIGTGTDPLQWPMMSHGRGWPRNTIFPGTTDPTTIPNGMTYDTITDTIWVSMQDIYAGGSDPEPPHFVSAINYTTGELVESQKTATYPANLFRPLGGGLMLVPEVFANEHFGGKRLALARGGLTGGQGGSSGPAIGVTDANLNSGLHAVDMLMRFEANDAVNADRLQHETSNCQRTSPYDLIDHVERAPAIYVDVCGTVRWKYPVDPVTGEGYFGTSSIRGNPTWIDDDIHKGVVWVVRSPKGEVRYEYQTECLSQDYQSTLYIYDPDDFAAVAAGTKQQWEMRGSFFEFPKATPGIVRSVSWDKENKLLWFFMTKSWARQGTYYPSFAAYRITE